jgi:hypothetical protein
MTTSTTLKSVLKPKTNNNSSKTPQYYNAEKTTCITELAGHPEATVRKAVASNTHTPTKILTTMLKCEQDKQVLKEVLMNPNIPRKSVATFIFDQSDNRVDWFNDDQEIVEQFK